MKKSVLLQIIFLTIIILIVIAYIYTSHDNDYYDNYNRVIQEPDTLKVIELR
jgi:uncharacterized membrane protein (DUF485 family)